MPKFLELYSSPSSFDVAIDASNIVPSVWRTALELGSAALLQATDIATAAQGAKADAAAPASSLGSAAYLAATAFATSAQGALAATAIQPTTLTWSNLLERPVFATVATSGSYADLANLPSLGSLAPLSTISNAEIASDAAIAWSKLNLTGASLPWSGIASRPTTLAGYGITDAATATQGAKADAALLAAFFTWDYLGEKPNFATVSFTGNYGDLLYRPALGALAPLSTISNAEIASDAAIAWSKLNLTGASLPWSGIASRPTTLAGYGITDALGGSSIIGISQAITSPNGIVPVAILSALSSSSGESDLALIPKGGGGSILAAIPDDASGGNKRGSSAVDLQLARESASKVASGLYSTLVGGYNNSATQYGAAVYGGAHGNATGQYAGVLAGSNANASGSGSAAISGASCTASGARSATLAGASCTASGIGAVTLGGDLLVANGPFSVASGQQATARGLRGAKVHSAGGFINTGDAQHGTYLARTITTGAQTMVMTFDTNLPGTTNQLILANYFSVHFRLQFTGRRIDQVGLECAAFEISGLINRDYDASQMTLLNSVKTVIHRPSVVWDVNIGVDTVNGGLSITATGEAGRNIRWLCTIHTTELGG